MDGTKGTKGTKWSGRVRKAAQDIVDDSMDTALETGSQMTKTALASGKSAVSDAGHYVKGVSATMIGNMAHGARDTIQRVESSAKRSARGAPARKPRQNRKTPPSK